jgi:Putative threonine efflux protein
MIYKGFKFGMLLQFAIGPVCMFIFQIAAQRGFYIAEMGVLGVVLLDGLYILAAILGIAVVIDRKNIRLFLKVSGAVVLFVFGFDIILNQFHISLLPNFTIPDVLRIGDVFLHAVILTASNPLTIIFWAGVFSTRIIEERMKRSELYAFGSGAFLSTLFFLTLIALTGSFIRMFLSREVIKCLNVLVGVILICFSIKMFHKKN